MVTGCGNGDLDFSDEAHVNNEYRMSLVWRACQTCQCTTGWHHYHFNDQNIGSDHPALTDTTKLQLEQCSQLRRYN